MECRGSTEAERDGEYERVRMESNQNTFYTCMKLSNGKMNQWNEYIVVSRVLSGYWLEGCIGSVDACVRAGTRQTWWGSWRWPLSRETPDQDGTGYAWRIQLLPSWVYENKYGLEKIILGNLKIKWKFKLQTCVSGNWWIVCWKPPKAADIRTDCLLSGSAGN